MPHRSQIAFQALVIVLLCLPFAFAVFGLRGEAAAPTAMQTVLLLALLALPVWALRRLQGAKAPGHAPTLYD